MAQKIAALKALQVLDSRGNPTVSVALTLEDGGRVEASVPSGASTGEFEAIELRDGANGVYGGKGVLNAVNNINREIAQVICGMQVDLQEEIDKKMLELDGTHNKQNLGANAILGVSLAVARANALDQKKPLYEIFLAERGDPILPIPLVNVLNGGAHANNSLDIQEFMLVPHGANCFADALRAAAETFHTLGELLEEDGYSVAVGDEGGYAPRVESTDAAFDFLIRSIEQAGYKPGEDISLALDVAASELRDSSESKPVYCFARSSGKRFTSDELIDYYDELSKRYPIISIEDGLDENDWEGWETLTSKLGDRLQLVGDDLFVTNTKRLLRGIENKVANSILIKPNQIGTLTETIDAIQMADKAGFRSVVSHRSGETCDSTIADLAVGMRTGQIKTGSMSRGERLAKYNRLLWIESNLGKKARLAKPNF